MKSFHLLNNRYAIASILSPILAVTLIIAYQSIANADYWSAINEANGAHSSESGAMMAFTELVEIIVALTIGSFVGIVTAIKSIRLNKTKFGIIAFVYNVIPFLFFGFLWVKGIIYGI